MKVIFTHKTIEGINEMIALRTDYSESRVSVPNNALSFLIARDQLL
jgi:hypothetical protein